MASRCPEPPACASPNTPAPLQTQLPSPLQCIAPRARGAPVMRLRLHWTHCSLQLMTRWPETWTTVLTQKEDSVIPTLCDCPGATEKPAGVLQSEDGHSERGGFKRKSSDVCQRLCLSSSRANTPSHLSPGKSLPLAFPSSLASPPPASPHRPPPHLPS